MLFWIKKTTYAYLVPFSNGRCEGANPSSHVTELPDLWILKPILQTSYVILN